MCPPAVEAYKFVKILGEFALDFCGTTSFPAGGHRLKPLRTRNDLFRISGERKANLCVRRGGHEMELFQDQKLMNKISLSHKLFGNSALSCYFLCGFLPYPALLSS